MNQFKVTVSNSKGFHLRPASKLLQLVSQFSDAEIHLHNPATGHQADCRNMMALMMMSAPQGTVFTVEVIADNAQEIQQVITDFFAQGFGEES